METKADWLIREIEEIVDDFDFRFQGYGDYFMHRDDESDVYPSEIKDWLRTILTSQRQDWLRSEIEVLEGQMVAKGNYNCGEEGCCNPNPKDEREKEDFEWQIGYNQALTSIITRYKEELKVLTEE